ncbi:MAG: hypothetical protein LBO72_11085 [Helicobacteraceae bacterium]|nr:hypothetical protein [Helicobacteraceae bacterium]
MNRNVVALALIAAGVVMSGCAAYSEIYGSALGVAESRQEINEQTMFNCSLITDQTKQNECKAEANVAIRACDKGSNMVNVNRDCYRAAHNETVKALITDCNKRGGTEKEACLKRVPPEKEIKPVEKQEPQKPFSITN